MKKVESCNKQSFFAKAAYTDRKARYNGYRTDVKNRGCEVTVSVSDVSFYKRGSGIKPA